MHLPVSILLRKIKPIQVYHTTMGHKNNRTPGAFGKRREWKPFRYDGRLPRDQRMTLGDVVQVFTTLHIAEERAKSAERQQQLAFELGRKVEALDTLQKENERLVAELDQIQHGVSIVTSAEGRSILARIISNNKKATDLKSVIAEIKGKMK